MFLKIVMNKLSIDEGALQEVQDETNKTNREDLEEEKEKVKKGVLDKTLIIDQMIVMKIITMATNMKEGLITIKEIRITMFLEEVTNKEQEISFSPNNTLNNIFLKNISKIGVKEIEFLSKPINMSFKLIKNFLQMMA